MVRGVFEDRQEAGSKKALGVRKNEVLPPPRARARPEQTIVQVSLDSLWTLQKLRDDNPAGSAEKPSIFDRDSLRAMPLGLGLQYAAMSESRREQVARRYAHAQVTTAAAAAASASAGAQAATAGSDECERSAETGARERKSKMRARELFGDAGGGDDSGDASGGGAGGGAGGAAAAVDTVVAAYAAPETGASLSGYHDKGGAGDGREENGPANGRTDGHVVGKCDRWDSPTPQRSSTRPVTSPSQSPAAAAAGGEVGVESTPSTPRSIASLPRSAELLRNISLSQVDRDVLDCLPQEVREEVLRAIVSNSGGGPGGRGRMGGAFRGEGGGNPHRTGRNDGSLGNDNQSEGRADQTVEQGGSLVRNVDRMNDQLDAQVDADVVDLRSPDFPTPTTPPPTPTTPPPSPSEPGVTWRGKRKRVFEVEGIGVLRSTLRGWIGGAVASPSQWHLELLYRYVVSGTRE